MQPFRDPKAPARSCAVPMVQRSVRPAQDHPKACACGMTRSREGRGRLGHPPARGTRALRRTSLDGRSRKLLTPLLGQALKWGRAYAWTRAVRDGLAAPLRAKLGKSESPRLGNWHVSACTKCGITAGVDQMGLPLGWGLRARAEVCAEGDAECSRTRDRRR